MDNAQIASVFNRIAALLEVKGEIHFKIRAYQRVAQTIYGLTRPLAEIYGADGLKGLQAFPGIGEATARKIEQMVTDGRCRQLDELKSSLPAGVEELLAVPHLGPKTVIRLTRDLKIDGLASLERAISAGRLRDLPGLGAKQEDKILKGIQILRQGQERMLLGNALPLALTILSTLEALPEVKRVVLAGSLRRMQETIGDLDFLVAPRRPRDAAAIMAAFTSLPQAGEVIASGNTKSSVRLQAGTRADLRIVDVKSFGAALHYFTGSKTHNIQVRERGVKRGLKINEYGVFKGSRRIGGRTEEEVFRAVGLPFIPPEIREGAGEIEAAIAKKLPRLVEARDLKGDLHVHTSSSDGAHTIEQMVTAARRLGLKYIAICDHSRSLKIAGGLSIEELRAQNHTIDRMNRKLKGFRILKGAEVDILGDGALDYPDEVLAELDVVVAAIHSRFNLGEAEQTRRTVRALTNPAVTLLAHPTGRLLRRRGPFPIDMGEVIKAARDHGKSLELNAQTDRLDLSPAPLRQAREAGVPIAINSDGHHTSQLESILRYGVAQARRGWLTSADVLNALPLAELLKKL